MRRFLFLSFMPLFVLAIMCCPNEAKSAYGSKPESISKTDSIKKLLQKIQAGRGTCSKVTIDTVYVDTFIESADYGPMWFGDTLAIEKTCFSIKFELNKIDKEAARLKSPYVSSDWHSDEELLIALDGSISLIKYTCRFGGIPPSFGYANKRIYFDENITALFNLLSNEKK